MILEYILTGLINLLSNIVEGCTGFGATVIASPFTTAWLGASVAVAYGAVITYPFLFVHVIRDFKKIAWKAYLFAMVVLACGMPIGQKVFRTLNADQCKLAVGFIVSCVALSGIYKYIIKLPKAIQRAKEAGEELDEFGMPKEKEDTMVFKVLRVCALFLGGIVHGAFVIGGPLVTMYTLKAIKEKTSFRATMCLIWITLNTWNIINYAIGGELNIEVWKALAIGFPLACVGRVLGIWIHDKVDQIKFLKIVYLCLAMVGLNMFIRAALVVF